MKTEDLPVKVHCPISNTDDYVFFYPIEVDGKWYIDINSFNGCDHGWHSCNECETCKTKAYQKVFNSDK